MRTWRGRDVLRAVVLVGSGAAAGIVLNAVRPEGIRLASSAPLANVCPSTATGAAASSAAAAPAVGPVQVLPPSEAVGLCGESGTLLADVREADAFARGHVTGAVHLPCAASGSAASNAARLLDGHHTLIVYGESTDDARPVAEEMRRRVPRPDLRVLVVAGGFSAWNQAGLACSSGPCPDCQPGTTVPATPAVPAVHR